jgi:cytochrome c oxidase subunit 3
MSAPFVRTIDSPARTGVLVGIAAITMAFAALTSALVIREGSGADWLHFQLPRILIANSLVLMISGLTLELSRGRLAVEGAVEQRAPALRWLLVTLALGFLFLGGQYLAWRELVAQGLYLSTSPSSAFFYLFTVLHAAHVLGGLVALTYAAVRVWRSAAPPLAAVAAAATYWHFMLALWLYLLLLLWIRV